MGSFSRSSTFEISRITLGLFAVFTPLTTHAQIMIGGDTKSGSGIITNPAWDVASNLVVGVTGVGNMSITNGSVVSNWAGSIGAAAGSSRQ